MLFRLALELFRYTLRARAPMRYALFLIFHKIAGGYISPLMEKHCFRFLKLHLVGYHVTRLLVGTCFRSLLMAKDGPIY